VTRICSRRNANRDRVSESVGVAFGRVRRKTGRFTRRKRSRCTGRMPPEVKQGRRTRGDAGRSARRLRQPGPGASFEAPRSIEEAGTPGEQLTSSHPSRGETRGGRWTGTPTPRGPGEGREPGLKVEGGVDGRREAARRRRRNVCAADRSNRRAVSNEHARRNGRPDAQGATPCVAHLECALGPPLRESPGRSVRARGLSRRNALEGRNPTRVTIHEPVATPGKGSGTREEERSEVDGALRG
jgi:hypothetical protein